MEQKITNQFLIVRPCHVNVHSAGSQRELGPQLVNRLIGTAHLQHFDQRRQLSEDWQRGTWGSRFVHNQFLGDAILSIPSDQKTTKSALPLVFQLTLTEAVSLKMKIPPTRCLQSPSLVTGKIFDTPKVSHDFTWSLRQHRNVLAAEAKIEKALFASCIGSSSDEEPTHFICPHTFFILYVRFERTRRCG